MSSPPLVWPTLPQVEASTGRHQRVACTVEIAHTADECYAHVVLDGIEVEPGDQVLVHGAPTRIGWGEQLRCEREATVSRATWLDKLWTRLSARFELTMLYEVSFSPARFSTSRPYPRPQRPLRAAAPISTDQTATPDAAPAVAAPTRTLP